MNYKLLVMLATLACCLCCKQLNAQIKNKLNKSRLEKELQQQLQHIKKPFNEKPYQTVSLEDYLEWNRFLNKRLAMALLLIQSYSGKISVPEYNQLKINTIAGIEFQRLFKFWSLCGIAGKAGLSGNNLAIIFDTTLFSREAVWARSLPNGLINRAEYLYAFNRAEVFRKYNFDNDEDSLKDEAKRKVLYYNLAKEKYKGLVREQLLEYLLTEKTIKDAGFVPETEYLLADYYRQPGFPQYKKRVKLYEQKGRTFRNGSVAPDFILTDSKGQSVTKNDVKGKIVLLDFWFTGCIGCIPMASAMKEIEERFKRDTNVLFISVSADKDKAVWQKSVTQGKYTTGKAMNLYTGGQGYKHPIMKTYSVTSFPTLYLLDPYGRIVRNPLPDPRKDNGEELIQLINHQLALLHDGPYVVYNKDSASVYSFYGYSPAVLKHKTEKWPVLQAQTDKSDIFFSIPLQKSLQIEPSEFVEPAKVFVLSDIEGNFEALRALLQSNGIVDENYDWTFGRGHLVFTGDMFDRGNQVTECLWLLYSLEEKAKAVGGYVHFILGNHEIMNLQGNHKYVQQKYKNNAAIAGKTLTELYNQHSELGRWLRTKNVIEKIGDLLFVHGGIHRDIAALPLTLQQINQSMRPYYATAKIDSSNHTLLMLYSIATSPLWYRDYYENDGDLKKPSLSQIDSSLQRFSANYIITGHTVVADTISAHYGGKVINTDTKHAEGKSEALLIEGDKFYRVNQQGKRVLLFVDERRRKNE